MKKSNGTTLIIVLGIVLLVVFCSVTAINLLPEHLSSQLFYAKIDDEMNGKVEELSIENSKLKIVVSGEIEEYCLKTTKSNPNEKNLCWHKMESDEVNISIILGKTYYVWVKDSNGKISSPKKISN